MTPSLPRRAAVAVLACAALTACTAGPGTAPPAPPAAAPDAPVPDAGAPAPTGDAAPVASLELDTTNAQDEVVSVRFDVATLERDGDTARLALRITNTSPDAEYPPLSDLAAGTVADFTLSGVSLVDLDNNLRHLVLVDSAGGCTCSDLGGVTLAPGDGIDAQASFPAPAADEVDVQLGKLGTVVAVPLTDR